MAKKTTIAYEKSCGNVFADLGLPHPEQEFLKASLTLQICRDSKAGDLTQVQAGRRGGLSTRTRRRPGRQLMPLITLVRAAPIFFEVTRHRVTVNIS